MGAENRLAEMGYKEAWPAKCCRNCACYASAGLCSRLVYAQEFNRESVPALVNEIGVCSKWISDDVASVYCESASREEAAVRLAVIGASPVEELDMALEKKRASDKMVEYAGRILDWMRSRGMETAFPTEATAHVKPEPARRGRGCCAHLVAFSMSGEFWSVWEWLRRNAPAYEAARSRKRILPDAMMHFDFKV